MSGYGSERAAPRTPPACREAALLRLRELGFEPLGSVARWRTYVRGAEVLRQGELGTPFFVITSGLVKACSTCTEGNCLILGLYGPGEVVGLASALCERRRRFSVVAVQPSECLEVDRQVLFKLFADKPGLITDLLPRLARSLAGCTNCLAQTVNQQVEPRLGCLFLRLLDRADACEKKEGWISVRWSRQELAELIGTTTESVSRVMSRWRQQQIVITADDGFWVRDRRALEQIALGRKSSASKHL